MRVLVTRPMPDAERTAAQLAAMGHQAVVAPLTSIRPMPFDVPQDPFDAIIVTSANAARANVPAAVPRDLPAYAVGQQTADAARAAGFADVRSADGGAHDVLAMVTAAQPRHACVLYLTGADRKPTLEVGLAAAGIMVLVRVVYAAAAAESLPAAAAAALMGETIEAVVHYSRRSAEIFCRLAVRAGLNDALRNLAHHCISADCAEPLRAADARTIVIAAAPNEKALLSDLSSRPQLSKWWLSR